MPDDFPQLTPLKQGSAGIIDFQDLTCLFATTFPGWLRADGAPLSWAHFVVGLDHVGRSQARESLRQAGAFSIAQTTDTAMRREWFNSQRAAAGWRG